MPIIVNISVGPVELGNVRIENTGEISMYNNTFKYHVEVEESLKSIDQFTEFHVWHDPGAHWSDLVSSALEELADRRNDDV